ncbi:hypothetical protein FN846DRAFT_25228 [Sphaerosporella brunnea]|uniref:Uncharacterized protein n=1 Tax=Sphaerosporella brunnea TaxID=1250544 RepID=A0A5J5EV41_9PEZI|nr:hypothetical protein FN846DRAFT_25228 [Sphaerosporella brunnea]
MQRQSLETNLSRTERLETLKEGRREGILVNYLSQDPQILCRRIPPIPPVADIREPFVFPSEESLDTIPVFDLTAEKVALDKEALALLSSIGKLGIEGREEELKLWSEEYWRYKELQLEEPLTRGDFVLPKAKSGIKKSPPLLLDDMADGGLTWSKTVRRDVAEFGKKLWAEKLEMSTDVRSFLKDSLRKQEQVDLDEFFAQDQRHNNWVPEPITPPMLPLSSLKIPDLPPLSLENLGVAPLEVPSNAEMAKELTEQLLKEDSFPSPASSPSQYIGAEPIPSSPLSLEPPPASEKPRLEVPLSPPLSAKRVRFGSILATDNHRLPFPLPIDAPKEEVPEENLLQAIAHADAQQLERELAQEQLQEADSVARLTVPVMDFSLPKPPWKISQKEAVDFLRNVDRWAGIAAKKRRGVRTLEIGMKWKPYTPEEIALPKETIEADNEVNELLLATEECDAAEQELINTFLNLGVNEGDELLPYGAFEQDFQEEKGNAEKEQVEKSSETHPEKQKKKQKKKENDSFNDLIRKRKSTKEALRPKKKKPVEKQEKDRFNAATSLNAFLNLRARSPSSFPSSPAQPHAPQKKPKPTIQTPAIATKPALPFPTPKLPTLPATVFIVSTTLLSQRPLFRAIKTLCPAAHFIERDFSIPIGDDSSFNLLTKATEIDDADLLLSPKTGLILTTLQRLRQRSTLPGETALFASGQEIKKRIACVCTRYERLLVLITTPSQLSSKSDQEVVAEFFGFVAAWLEECNIVPRVVVGTDEDVARWIVAMMRPGEWKLLEEETTWELFLRKAGCNAFAAQAVLGMCNEVGGMRGLLLMSAEERRGRFEGVVGQRVWARVERVLSGWRRQDEI